MTFVCVPPSGTIGHVAHGKSTVVKGLSGVQVSTRGFHTLITYKAVHKKKSVSCAAGGRNYGQSGGRIFFFFFFHIYFSLIGKYCPFLKKTTFFCKNEKKKAPVAPFLATRPVYRKQNYFYGQPNLYHYGLKK